MKKPAIWYVYALMNYLKTDKARYDLRDYFKAGLIMIFTMAILSLLVHMFFKG